MVLGVNAKMDLDHSIPGRYHGDMEQPNRIKELRQSRGWSQQQLADRVSPKTTQPQIDRLEKGERKLSLEWMERIAPALGVDPTALLPNRKGKQVSSNNAQQSVDAEPISGRVTELPGGERLFQGPRDLPILGHVKGGDGAWFIDQGQRLGVTMRPQMLDGNREAYATRVHDVSMSPALLPGWVLFVDPFRPAKPGDYVIIQMTDGQAFVKRLVRRTDRAVMCEQFNPPQQIEFKPSKVRAIHLVVLISPFEP